MVSSSPDLPATPAFRANGLREDIQVLRGWAVLLVVLHHAHFMGSVDAGYLGVDIFFVVSGFVITELLARQLFLLARQCGAAGLNRHSIRLYELARVASGQQRSKGLDFRIYRLSSVLLGWTVTGKLSMWIDRVRA